MLSRYGCSIGSGSDLRSIFESAFLVTRPSEPAASSEPGLSLNVVLTVYRAGAFATVEKSASDTARPFSPSATGLEAASS